MNLLLDAHIPPRLATRLCALGHDAIHVSTLLNGTATPDSIIVALADADGRIVVTKDSDFFSTRRDHGRPARLLLVKTGNMGRDEQIDVVLAHLSAIEAFFVGANCGELRLSGLTACA